MCSLIFPSPMSMDPIDILFIVKVIAVELLATDKREHAYVLASCTVPSVAS